MNNDNSTNDENDPYNEYFWIMTDPLTRVFRWLLQIWTKNNKDSLISYVEKYEDGVFFSYELDIICKNKIDELEIPLIYKLFCTVCENTFRFKELPLPLFQNNIVELFKQRNFYCNLIGSQRSEEDFEEIKDVCKELLLGTIDASSQCFSITHTECDIFRNKIFNILNSYTRTSINHFEQTELFDQYCKILMSAAPKVLNWILKNWLMKNHPMSNFKETIVDLVKSQKNKKGKNEFHDHEVKKIQTSDEDLGDLDVSLLCKLLSKICKEDFDFESLSRPQLEAQIQVLKTKRNEISHTNRSEKMIKLLGKIENILFCKENMVHIIELSTDRIYINFYECDKFISEITSEVNSILSWNRIGYKNHWYVFRQLQKSLESHYKEATFCFDIFGYPIDLKTVSERYFNLKVFKSFKSYDKGKVIKPFKLLEVFSSNDTQIIFVKGDGGVGKSFLLSQLVYERYNEEKHFRGIKKYCLVFLIQCRNNIRVSFKNYLREFIPKISQDKDWKDEQCDHFIDFLRLEDVIFFIDGLDEINEKSIKMIKEVFDTFKNKHFIITGRPGSEDRLPKDIKKIIVELECIDSLEKQSSFITRYCPGKENEIIEKIKCTPNEIKEVLVSPMYLTIFCFLFEEGRYSDLELPIDLIERFHDINNSKFLERIQNSSDLERFMVESSTHILMKRLQEFAWKSLKSDELSLRKSEVQELTKILQTQFSLKGKNLLRYLSCFLSYKISDSPFSSSVFSFHHKTFQEFYGTVHFIEKSSLSGEDKNLIKTFKDEVKHSDTFNSFDLGKWKVPLLLLVTHYVKSEDEFLIKEFIEANEFEILNAFWENHEVIVNFEEHKTNMRDIMVYSRYHMGESLSKKVSKFLWKLREDDIFLAKKMQEYRIPRKVLLEISKEKNTIDIVEFIEAFKKSCEFEVSFHWSNSTDFLIQVINSFKNSK